MMIRISDFHFFCYISNIYYFLVFSMFNIKIYDKDSNFKTTLSERSVSSDFSFSASVWSWVSTLKFDYYWDYVFKHRDIVKIFRDWKLIYQWFVIWINRISDKSWNKLTITLSWMLWLLAFTPWPDWTYSDVPWVLIRNIFLTASLLFNTDTIQNYYTSLSLQSSGNTCLEFLKEILKNTSDYWLFVTVNNEVLFWPYEREHILTYWKEVYWIEITEDSSEYYNKFRVNYSWWNTIQENSTEIEEFIRKLDGYGKITIEDHIQPCLVMMDRLRMRSAKMATTSSAGEAKRIRPKAITSPRTSSLKRIEPRILTVERIVA